MTTVGAPATTSSRQTGREFWRGVLAPAGSPRSRAGRSTRCRASPSTRSRPDDVAAALQRLADDLGVPLSAVLLAAHAKVLAALSGEREVDDRLRRPPGGRPCRAG